jgi:DnaA family protein
MSLRRQQQLLLDIGPEAAAPTLDNFIVGDNHELMARLRALGDSGIFDQIYLWGETGCGRSHLLAAAREAASAAGRNVCYLRGSDLGEELNVPPGSLIIIDELDQLSEAAQITLFRTFNAARLVGLALLLAGNQPPLQLALREDLRTRIGAALIYQVHPLSDREKAAALRNHATARGMRVDDALIDYLLHHGRRDLPSLLQMLSAADQASLELKRPLTLPLLREVLTHHQQQHQQHSLELQSPASTKEQEHEPGAV